MITSPLTYTRYFYKEDEVVISVCNYCYAVVAESNKDAELEMRERQHKCADQARAFAA